MNRSQKKELVTKAKNELISSKFIVIANQVGFSVQDFTYFRKGMRSIESKVKVIKNRLIKRSIQNTYLEELSNFLKGPVVVILSQNPIETSKLLINLKKENEKFKLLSGWLDGRILSISDIENLSKIPPLDKLRSNLILNLINNSRKLVTYINEPGSSLIRLLNLYYKIPDNK